jgi:glycosyltransferase involved in cell wall biosynthesis
LERWAFRATDYAIAGNHDAVQILRAKGYTGPARVIPQFGIDPALYASAAPPTDTFAIGYVGRLVPEKGLEDLLQATAGLRGRWVLRLLGAGPDRERLMRMCRSLGVADRVSFDGQIPSPAVPAYLSQLHALVLPSRTRPNWREQFGRVLIEAMASGVPVIGSDSGEIPNVIGEAGLVYPEGDAAALRTHLGTLIADGALWRDLARRGRQRVQAHYTQAQVAAATVAVYREILQGA